MNDLPVTSQHNAIDKRHEAAIAQIADALRGLRFGSLVVTVHDGEVVQIDRTEKKRLVRSSR